MELVRFDKNVFKLTGDDFDDCSDLLLALGMVFGVFSGQQELEGCSQSFEEIGPGQKR